jgi:phage antirepressor YoqD-like protein
MDLMLELTQIKHNEVIVITTKQLAEVYECNEQQISQNFKNNEGRFIEGKHYYKLEGEVLKEFKNQFENFESVVGYGIRTSCIYLWTKQGASRHCKMLGTDKAWDVFDLLEENYFSPKQEQLPLPQTYLEALEALVESEKEKQKLLEQKKILIEQNQALEEENMVMAPKAEYFDELVDRNLLTNFRDTAKELHVKQNEFMNFLETHNYIYRDIKNDPKPYATHVKRGLFEIKEFVGNNGYSGTQTLITAKGRETFRLLLSTNDEEETE